MIWRASDRPRAVGRGRYLLGDVIRRGPTATVYRARTRDGGAEGAVKRFGAARNAAESSRRRREVLVRASMDHPGVVPVHDADEEDGRYWVVMPFVPGGTLAERLRAGPLALDDVVALGTSLADALAHVHGHGVVLRGLTPNAILLDVHGDPRLHDLSAAMLPNEVTDTATSTGTGPYPAPEQVRGERATPASDVYALGVVLVECLGAHRRGTARDVEAVVTRLRRGPPELLPDLPAATESLLRAMTAPDAAARPTAEQVAAGLRGIVTAGPTPPAAPSGSGSAPGSGPRADGVFISYRRGTSWQLARLLYDDLTRAGYDVFVDVAGLDSGSFDQQVLQEIEERAHFVVVLQPTTGLDARAGGVDWMRNEIAHALALGRNVVPVMSDGFAFARDPTLPDDISRLAHANGVTIYPEYVDAGLERLRTRFLRKGTPG